MAAKCFRIKCLLVVVVSSVDGRSPVPITRPNRPDNMTSGKTATTHTGGGKVSWLSERLRSPRKTRRQDQVR